MVAPYEVGDPVRSYVKVPGSGTNESAKALFCDLSHVSPVAAVPPIIVRPVQPPQASATAAAQDPPKEDQKNQQVVAESPKGTRTQSQKDESQKENIKIKKRLREDIEDAESKPDINVSPAKRVRIVPHVKNFSKDVKGGNLRGVGINIVRSRSSSSVGTQTDLISEEVRECNQLREKNKVLERRLAVFKDIFRSKKNLAKLIRALEVGTPS
ncbi:uncharacterized protein [Palaemon carinicauda]